MFSTSPSFLRAIFMVTILLSTLLSHGCSSRVQVDSSNLRTIDISQLDENEQFFQRLKETGTVDEPVVVKIPAGFTLPVTLNLDTPLATMHSDANSLVFKRDFYAYISNSEMLFSPDGIEWAHFGDMDESKELFGAGPGRMAVSLNNSKNEGSTLFIDVIMAEAAKKN